MWSFALLAVALLSAQASAASIALEARAGAQVCEGQVNLEETYIGKDKNVHVQFATCPAFVPKSSLLESRQTAPPPVDVCGNPCNTSCFEAGTSPVANDCHIIADALRFDSQNIGALFTVANGTNNTVAMTFASCLTFFVNQDTVPIEYCRTDWAALVDIIAPRCQGTTGGLCVATNQQWFVDTTHSAPPAPV
ncbi:hypothetical protein GGX14DRAFT_654839 [Mycena pura]|uniref:Uncharacterized protein n=1 Tax=Mycena pura TaxID=153505 RepID=A0AAD6Y8H4_9AGAR|nr:hypothetical protein GGX14DRAFT_654839 [Mycena pura]